MVGEDSGFQILSSKDEEAEREKPRKVISTKIHKKKPIKAIHDHRKDDLSQNLEKAKKLLDVKAAIEKLRLRTSVESDGEGSDLSSSTSSSESSSSSESDSEVAIGKKHALKKYAQFALNTSCFWESTGSNITPVVQFYDIFVTKIMN